MLAKLQQLTEARAAITQKVAAEKRAELTPGEVRQFKALGQEIDVLRAELKRAGYDNPEVNAIRSATQSGDGWASRTAAAIRQANGETRAISSGSLDVPSVITPSVTPKTRPERLIDLLVNRAKLDSNAFEYFRQTVRTNAAAPVADGAVKPTSTFTVAPITDRARVVAHLSEPVPIRLWADASDVIQWLDAEMRAGVLDAVEAQIIAGSGTGENMTGLLTVAGTNAVAFATDVVTTLRKAVTALQVAAVTPNAWVLNPADAEAIDLTKEGTGGIGFLLDGYAQGNSRSGNVFGDGITRVISNSVPAGTAVLGDFSQIRLLVREEMRLDIDAGGELFTKNQAIMRAETRVGVAHLRPASFAVVDLTV